MSSAARLISSFLSLQQQTPLRAVGGVLPSQNAPSPQQPLNPIKPINSSPASNFSCLPSQSCWPSKYEWRSLNATLDGRLQVTVPFAHACYVDPTSDACKQTEEEYGVAENREAVYGAMQNLKWESCGASNCELNSLAPEDDLVGECELGRLSAYYVNATEESHVVATVNFVRENNIRLSIKNTGHDYFGRSSAPNSLALWTQNIKRLEFYDNFSLSNCPGSPELRNIGVMGAGTAASDAVAFFERFGMHVTVGAASSVGVAGGFGTGGGHGPLAPSYGLMVDQAVEFDVVTADGQLRTINQCNDPDLFWAMRGGGGGAFGVLTSYKLRVHPALPLNVHMIEALIPFNQTSTADVSKSQSHRDIAMALALNQQQWSKNGIAGYNFFMPDKFISILILPSSNPKAIISLTAQWAAFLSTYPGLHVAAEGYQTFANYSQFSAWTNSPEIAKNGLIGIGIAESSRLIPQSQFSTFASVQDLVDTFLEGLQISLRQGAGLCSGVGQIYATTPSNTPDAAGATAANPAWRDSLWHVVYPGMYLSNYTKAEQDSIFDTVGAAIQPLKRLTPDSGAYMNEGDWKEPQWRETFFGANYDNLLAIKRRYDPEGLFSCWKCVGWEENADPIYSCYDPSDVKPIPSIPLPYL